MKAFRQDLNGLLRPCALACVCTLVVACGGGGGTADESTVSAPLISVPLASAQSARLSAAATKVSATPEVNIGAYGAICDGQQDNSAAIERAIAAAKSMGATVVVPDAICAYSDIIRLDGVKLRGDGYYSTLYALNWQKSSIFMSGVGSEVREITLSGYVAPSRQSNWEMTRIALFGAQDFVIDLVTINGSSAAGIQTAQGTTSGRITNNVINATLSDSIHITGGASFITVEGNVIDASGDDGIAVVSYRGDNELTHDITARNNWVFSNRSGRQMSVVGGKNILYENNYLQNSGEYACIYIAQESSYATFGVSNVTVQGNTTINCGSKRTGHGAVMIYGSGEEPISEISILANNIGQSGQAGVRVAGPLISGIRVEGNVVTGASPAYDIQLPAGGLLPPISASSPTP